MFGDCFIFICTNQTLSTNFIISIKKEVETLLSFFANKIRKQQILQNLKKMHAIESI